MKKLISIRLTKFLEDNNILADQHLGFRKDHSTTHADTDFYSQICNNLDNGKHSCVVLLDLKKAFDTVNHEVLLRKLDKYGIRGNSNKLFQSYLSNRCQFVCVNGIASNKRKVQCGVPQASVPGPTLFSLYVNDLSKFTEPSVRLFADDTIMIMSDNSLDNLNNTANNEAKIIDKWLTSNELALNTFKTSFMLVSTKKISADKFSLTIRGEKINRTPVAKYLGLLIGEKLKFDVHAKHVCKKLSQICGIFCNLRHYICKKTLLMLYYSLVNSHILYGILVWGSTNHSILRQLQVLQNKIIRIICNVRKNEHVKNNTLYHELKLLKVKDMYHLEMAKFVYLFHHNKL